MIFGVLGQILRIIFYIGLIYYLLIAIFFLMSWFSGLYGTRLFDFFRRITSPFMNLCSGKLIMGGFDLGATLGLILYGFLLYLIDYLSLMM